MTAAARRIESTPMAPYVGVMKSMSKQDIDIVLSFLHEVKKQAEESNDIVSQVRAKYNIPESEEVKWLREHALPAPEWDTQAAWDRLTDAQREQAVKLKLTADDMDIRTYCLLTKWVRE